MHSPESDEEVLLLVLGVVAADHRDSPGLSPVRSFGAVRLEARLGRPKVARRSARRRARDARAGLGRVEDEPARSPAGSLAAVVLRDRRPPALRRIVAVPDRRSSPCGQPTGRARSSARRPSPPPGRSVLHPSLSARSSVPPHEPGGDRGTRADQALRRTPGPARGVSFEAHRGELLARDRPERSRQDHPALDPGRDQGARRRARSAAAPARSAGFRSRRRSTGA